MVIAAALAENGRCIVIRSHSNWNRWAWVGAALLVAAGCIPEKRVVWSPDGSRAAVIAGDGLRIAYPDGRISPPLRPLARRVAWFPDGKRLLSIEAVKVGTWKEVAVMLPEAEHAPIAGGAARLREQLLAHKGDWDAFKPDDGPLTGGQAVAAFLYLRDRLGEGLAAHVGEKWADLEKLECVVWHTQVVTLDGESATAGKPLLVSLDELRTPTVSALGRCYAVLRSDGSGERETLNLFVGAVDSGAAPRLLARNVSVEYAWSPDGRSLAFIHAPPGGGDGGTVQLGALATADVTDASGALAIGSMQDRAGVLFNRLLCVRWPSPNRIVFSTYEVSLPATTRDMPQGWTLFALDPSADLTVQRLVPRDVNLPIEKDVAMFEISPDGQRVLVAGGQGRVTLLDLRSGATTELAPARDRKSTSRTVPVWRNSEEACVKVLPADPAATSRIELVRDVKTRRVLSTGWPQAAVDGWLTPEEPAATQPASR